MTPLSVNNGKDRNTSEYHEDFSKLQNKDITDSVSVFFFYRIFQHFVNLNTTQEQLLPTRAYNVMKRQKKDDRRKSGRIMTFNR